MISVAMHARKLTAIILTASQKTCVFYILHIAGTNVRYKSTKLESALGKYDFLDFIQKYG